ncbi:MAG TPA: MFS transporter [Bryobacteraceae bacterium]|nr:MFS transporter [Bryobacteraceae bacterium]
MTATSRESHNAPWLFGILVLPYGFTTAVTVLLMPYLLRKYGMPVDRIAEIGAIAILPAIWSFLWSPLADAGLRRSTWIVIAAVTASAASAVAVLDVHGGQAMLTALLFLANALTGLLSSACGALLTAMPENLRGHASGWYQAGNVGGGALAGGSVIWLADHASLGVVAGAVAAAMVLPSLAALLVAEPPPVRRAMGPLLAGMAHDLGDLLRSRRTWLGLAFFLSPVGTAAVSNLISSVGPDYRASGNEVALITGVVSGLLSSLACFLGGIVADRMSRMAAYALAGVLTAIFAGWMALGPLSAFTYGAGYAGYSIATGFGYAVYTALLLEVLGKREHAAAFAYSVLNASGNVSISYMTWLDGVGYKHGGARGLMGMDAAANGIFAVILLVVAAFAGRIISGGESPRSRPV